MDHTPCGPDLLLPQFPEGAEAPSLPREAGRLSSDFQRYLEPNETPFTTSLWGEKPEFCVEHYQEPRFPEHAIWAKARELLQSVTPEDNEYWSPSQAWHNLSHIVRELYKLAFNLVPNPTYDAERCRDTEWYKRRRGINQNKVAWGTSNLIEIPTEE